MPSFSNFIHTQFILRIPKPTASFATKIVIITGASSGLGKETAKHIVRLGASKVILGCRNISKGNNAKHEIESSLRCGLDIIEVWEVDIESSSSVKGFVERASKLPRLDVLINNAGIQTLKFQTAYGTERTIAVNVIGTFLLALQLLPKLKETAKQYGVVPHMTFVGSALYDMAKYPEKHGDDLFAWLSNENHVNMMNQYNLSKLLLLHAIIQLASTIDPITNGKSEIPNPIVVNSLDPCFCKTDLAGGLTGGLKMAFKVFEFICGRPAEEGSRLVVIAASAGRMTHGGYMRAGAVEKYAPFITSKEEVQKGQYIWKELGRELEQLEPGILGHVKTV